MDWGLGGQTRSLNEILRALETVVHDALKCFKVRSPPHPIATDPSTPPHRDPHNTPHPHCAQVRAFLVTSPFIGMEPGALLFLRKVPGAGPRSAAAFECVSVPIGR